MKYLFVLSVVTACASSSIRDVVPVEVSATVVCDEVTDYSKVVVDILLKDPEPMERLRREFLALKQREGKEALAEAACAVLGAREQLGRIQNTKEQIEGAVRSAREAYELAQSAASELGL